ncbi:MAG: metallopeptidase family protein [Propionibacteriaceae bacterium]|jgi:hypothetical protein|nr:metallopeptidase family protein [Propionibacteriaceae bacterium]
MSKRRDRHERGLRGPLALPNPVTRIPALRRVDDRRTRFAAAIEAALERIALNCPQALPRVDIGFEEVPTKFVPWETRIPLAAANSATGDRHGQIVLFRRPIERRTSTNAELRQLVRSTIVEQLSAITGFPVSELDPESDQD